jgi:hypothetical protein
MLTGPREEEEVSPVPLAKLQTAADLDFYHPLGPRKRNPHSLTFLSTTLIKV